MQGRFGGPVSKQLTGLYFVGAKYIPWSTLKLLILQI